MGVVPLALLFVCMPATTVFGYCKVSYAMNAAYGCPAGEYCDGSLYLQYSYCQPCLPGTISTGGKVTSCKRCPAGEYSASSTSCSVCQGGNVSAEGASSCAESCPDGFWQNTASGCTACGKDTVSCGGQAPGVCKPDFFRDAYDQDCRACSANSLDCKCKDGFYGNATGGVCIACPGFTVKSDAMNGDDSLCQLNYSLLLAVIVPTLVLLAFGFRCAMRVGQLKFDFMKARILGETAASVAQTRQMQQPAAIYTGYSAVAASSANDPYDPHANMQMQGLSGAYSYAGHAAYAGASVQQPTGAPSMHTNHISGSSEFTAYSQTSGKPSVTPHLAVHALPGMIPQTAGMELPPEYSEQ